MYAALNSDPSDPDVIIKLDICNASNALCRQLTLDVLGGQASSDYACGLKGDNNGKAGGQQGGPLEMIMGPDPRQAQPGRLRCSVRCRWLHQSQAVRRARGALGHQAGSQGGRWPGPH